MKNKLDDSWFDYNTLVWLAGTFTQVKKSEIKAILDNLNIKWTIKESMDITKILTDELYLRSNNSPSNPTDQQKLNCSIYQAKGTLRPLEFLNILRNRTAENMNEFNTQIITLLKSNDLTNTTLAVSMISNSILEDDWIPWLLYRKDDCTEIKELLRKNNISPGGWHVDKMKSNLRWAINDVLCRLEVEGGWYDKINNKHNEFIKEFIDVLMNED